MSALGNKAVMARNIEYYMALNNKSRSDVCNDLQISYTTFADWVNGKTYPRIDKIEAMANYFHITKSDLVEKNSPAASGEGKLEDAILFSAYKAAPENVQAAIRNLLGLK